MQPEKYYDSYHTLWRLNGELHRKDGPAIIILRNRIQNWLHGINVQDYRQVLIVTNYFKVKHAAQEN